MKSTALMLILFKIDTQIFALNTHEVKKVCPAVYITPLPDSPEIVSGVISFYGTIIPVVNLRKRLCYPDQELRLQDHIIVLKTSKRTMAIVVDEILEIQEQEVDRIASSDSILTGSEYVQGITQNKDGIIFIPDIEKFLSINEEQQLDTALHAYEE